MEIHGFTPNIVFFLLSNSAVQPVDPTSGVTNANLNEEYEFIQPALGPTPLVVASNPFNNPYIPTFASDATFNK